MLLIMFDPGGEVTRCLGQLVVLEMLVNSGVFGNVVKLLRWGLFDWRTCPQSNKCFGSFPRVEKHLYVFYMV